MKGKNKTAVICAWRKGETELAETLESAKNSIGVNDAVIAVEDKTAAGPARTRHRGIDAAADADVIIIIDAHMRFMGDTLTMLANHVRKHGGIAMPLVHHNPLCAFEGFYDLISGADIHASGPQPGVGDASRVYAGARIVYRAKDGQAKYALSAKWSKDIKPGPRGAVMGACYAFRRDWYYSVGQPLAALPGWGCDEEALSISAWMSGHMPVVLDCRAAHRWRNRTPWNVSSEECARVLQSRMALIHAVVTEAGARRELEEWQRSWVREGIPASNTPEAERWRLALLKQPRKWAQWRKEVCEPDEIDGVQIPPIQVAADESQRSGVKNQKSDGKHEAPKVTRVQNPVVIQHGVQCPHCGTNHDPLKLEVTHVFPNGNRRRMCPACQNPFISHFIATT